MGPVQQPTYDLRRTWEENRERGPQFATAPPTVPPTPMKSFLGLPVASRFGIAAGLLLDSRWLLAYARRGFDILTYKTVRSAARACYPPPNWVFVDEGDDADGPVYVLDAPPADPARISSAVCFGMPSVAPELWRADVRRAREGLAPGQILVVSVVATPDKAPTARDIAADFGRCAAWAAEAGAHVIEANLSCPNVCSAEGTLYHDAELSRAIVGDIRTAIGSTPLLLKIGAFRDAAGLRGFLRAVDGLAAGVTLVNGLSRPVLRRDGTPAFGPQFRTAGVLGRAIHEPSVAAVRAAVDGIRADGLALQIAAVGGVASPNDVADFLAAGADAVLCGSSPMVLPDLAIEMKRRGRSGEDRRKPFAVTVTGTLVIALGVCSWIEALAGCIGGKDRGPRLDPTLHPPVSGVRTAVARGLPEDRPHKRRRQ